jgi:hypothetical protein
MKNLCVHSCLFVVILCSFCSSCAETQKFFARSPEIPATAPIAEAGQDLQSAVALATQAYVDKKNGDTDFAWSIKKGLEVYQLYVKTKQDVKAIVQQWSDGTAAGKSFAEKLASLFAASTGSPEQKAQAMANGVQTAALAAPGP